jgi:cytosine/adenosine deaminase-related metal-dependent hydrolase
LSGYSDAVIAGLAPHYTPEDLYAGTLWGALQALNAGITTVADWSHNLATPRHADANVRALHDSGIRGVFLYGGPGPDGLAFFGVPAPQHPDDAQRTLDKLGLLGPDINHVHANQLKQADVTVVDMRPPHLDGFGDPVATLVMGAGAADVETVVVGGEIVKAAGTLVASLAERARELMHESRAKLRDRTSQNAS